jgi:radical SAM protein with 4Fe4S-binding SPASM domain
MSFGEIRSLLQAIKRLGGEEITLLGGEPLMRPDWFALCELVGHLGMRLILISNGTLMGDAERDLLKKLRPFVLGISIDGADAGSYRARRGINAWEQVVALLHALRADGHENVNGITTVTRSNLLEFDAFAELFDGTGITWQLQIANKGGERFDEREFITREEYFWLAGKMRDVFVNRPSLRLRHMDDFGYFPIDPALRFIHETWNGCIAGRELIGVRSNGDLLGCLSMGDEFVEANLRTTNLESFWIADESFERFRNKPSRLTGRCKACPFSNRCAAGCSSIAWSATGGLGCNPYCIRSLEEDGIHLALDRALSSSEALECVEAGAAPEAGPAGELVEVVGIEPTTF